MMIILLLSTTVKQSETGFPWELILSAVTAIAAIAALYISVRSIKTQKAVDLFKERYEVYSKIEKILNKTDLFTSESVSGSFLRSSWFVLFYDLNLDINERFRDVKKTHNKIKALGQDDSAKARKTRQKLNKHYKKQQDELLAICYPIMLKDISIMNRSKLLFPSVPFNPIQELIEVYKDSVLRFQIDEDIDDLIKRWKKVHEQFEAENTLEEMEKLITFVQ